MKIDSQKRFLIQVGFWLVILVIIGLALRYVVPFFMPFLVALLIAAVLNRPITFFQNKLGGRRAVPSIVLTAAFYLAAIGIFFFLGLRLFFFLADMVGKLPGFYRNTLEPLLWELLAKLEEYVSRLDPQVVSLLSDAADTALNSMSTMISSASVWIATEITGLAAAIPGSFLNLVITIIVTFFLALDYPEVMGFVMRQFPEGMQHAMRDAKGYVGGTLVRCILSYALILSITFFEVSAGLTILQVPNAVLIGICIAVFDILPVVGTGGIMIPWALICLLLGKWTLGFGLLALYLFITVVRNVIEPKIVGHQVGLHPVVTLASMLAGLQMFGIVGLFGFPITLSLIKNMNDRGVIHLFK